jgi:hypothetical protein
MAVLAVIPKQLEIGFSATSRGKFSVGIHSIRTSSKQKKPSGAREEEIIKTATEEFLDIEGKPFRFENCVAILQDKMPKFDPMVAEYVDKELPSEHDNDGAVMEPKKVAPKFN